MSRSAGTRVVCHCDDCQAYARFLGTPGITDAAGGTDIFQMAPARMRLHTAETLRCLRLSSKGIRRFYCGVCRTPVANTGGPRMPFAGLIHTFMDHAGDGRTRDETLGPPRGHVFTKRATGPLPDERGSSLPRLIARSLRLLGTWWVTGAGRPSPFFDASGAPRVPPQVLTPEERRALSPTA